MSSEINGTDLYVFMDDDLIANSTSYTISWDMEARPITNKGSGVYKHYAPGLFDVTASCDGLMVYGGGATKLYDAMILRLPVKLDFGEKATGDVLDTLVDYYTGYFLITSFTNTAEDQQNATYSASFKPTNDFAKVEATVPEPVDIGGYYVSTTGDDATGDGSFANPWLTWQKGFTEIAAGDTLYIRGGIYTGVYGLDDGQYYGVLVSSVDGSLGNEVRVFNYPGEVPILDCSALTALNGVHYGVRLYECDYWIVKGLSVTNVLSYTDTLQALGWRVTGNNITLENCKSYANDGIGFHLRYGTNIYAINCDSYNNYDEWHGGEDGDGFLSSVLAGEHHYYINCRSWHNSDDGYDSFASAGYITYDGCWAFNNGYGTAGDGNGFKLGYVAAPKEAGAQRIVQNCLAFNNIASGFDESADGNHLVDITLYNNTSYNNNYGFGFYDETAGTGVVSLINNIAYSNVQNVALRAGETVTTNTFLIDNSANPAFTVTNADFISVNSTLASSARQSDGSLPRLDFLHLAVGSDLVAGGTNVGLSTDGDGDHWNATPSLGAFEYKNV